MFLRKEERLEFGTASNDSSRRDFEKLFAQNPNADLFPPFFITLSDQLFSTMVSNQVIALIAALLGGAWFLFGRNKSSTSSADRLAADPALTIGKQALVNGNGAADTGRDFVAAMQAAVRSISPSLLPLFEHGKVIHRHPNRGYVKGISACDTPHHSLSRSYRN